MHFPPSEDIGNLPQLLEMPHGTTIAAAVQTHMGATIGRLEV